MTAYDPSEHTVDEVQEHLENHPEQASAVLEAEKEGKARSTLLDQPASQTVRFTRKSPESGALEIESS